MKDQIKIAIATLSSLLDGIERYEDLKDQTAKLEAELDATKAELANVQTTLDEGHAGISAAAQENMRQHDAALLEKQNQLHDLANKISTMTAAHDELRARMVIDQAHYATVVAGIESLKETLRANNR